MSAERWLRQTSGQDAELWYGTERLELQSGNAKSRSWRQPMPPRGCAVACQEWNPWILQRGIAVPPDNCDIHLSPDSCNALIKHLYWGCIFYHLPCYFLYSLLDSPRDADRISQNQRKYFSDQGWKAEEEFWAGVGNERTVMLTVLLQDT